MSHNFYDEKSIQRFYDNMKKYFRTKTMKFVNPVESCSKKIIF